MIGLEPTQCVILVYSAGNDRNGNPRRCYVVKRIDGEYTYTVAVAEDHYDGFDALRDVLDYRYSGPTLPNGRFSTHDNGSGRHCWDRRREWERRVIAEVDSTATQIRRLVKSHREQADWEAKEAAAGRPTR